MRSFSVVFNVVALVVGIGVAQPAMADEPPSGPEPLASVHADGGAGLVLDGATGNHSGGEGAPAQPGEPASGSNQSNANDELPVRASSEDTDGESAIVGFQEDSLPTVQPGDELSFEQVQAAQSNAEATSGATAQQLAAVYRVYNPFTSEHVWTADARERDALVARGWYDEGTAWWGPASGVEVRRLYNPSSGEHHYTTDNVERAALVKGGWKDEGIAFYGQEEGVAVYRLYSAGGGIASHHLTSSSAEVNALVKAGWKSEGTSFFVSALGASKAWPAGAPARVVNVNVYRAYNPNSGEHLYTLAAAEVAALVKRGWYDEGIAWRSPSWSRVPVYRLYNRKLGDHHYTTDANEVQVLTSRYGWAREGIAFYSSMGNEVAVYRQFNPQLTAGSHHYTTAKSEYDGNNARNGWRGEGIAWYAKTAGVPKAHPAAPLSTVTAGLTDSSAREMALKAQNYASATNWLILTNESTARVGVFQRSNGRWYLKHYWASGPGAVGSSTIKGQFTIGNRGYSFGSGFTAYYWTQFSGDYLFHSILYYQGTFTVKDGTLGRRVSHGCVRLALENAKWINENIPRGTKVVSY